MSVKLLYISERGDTMVSEPMEPNDERNFRYYKLGVSGHITRKKCCINLLPMQTELSYCCSFKIKSI